MIKPKLHYKQFRDNNKHRYKQIIFEVPAKRSQHCWEHHAGVRLATLLRRVGTSCVKLGAVVLSRNWSNLLFATWGCCMMLKSVDQVRHCVTMLHTGMRSSSIFNTQHVAKGWPNEHMLRLAIYMLRYVVPKCCDRLAGACKCWTNDIAKCFIDMLRSYGTRGFMKIV